MSDLPGQKNPGQPSPPPSVELYAPHCNFTRAGGALSVISHTFLFFNDARARAPPWGASWPKRIFRRPLVAFFSPPGRPRANIHRFFGAPGTLQKSIHFWYPSKSTPGGGKVDPWPPWGRLGLQKRSAAPTGCMACSDYCKVSEIKTKSKLPPS